MYLRCSRSVHHKPWQTNNLAQRCAPRPYFDDDVFVFTVGIRQYLKLFTIQLH